MPLDLGRERFWNCFISFTKLEFKPEVAPGLLPVNIVLETFEISAWTAFSSQAHPCKMGKESWNEAPPALSCCLWPRSIIATRRGSGTWPWPSTGTRSLLCWGPTALGRPPSCASRSPFSCLPSRALEMCFKMCILEMCFPAIQGLDPFFVWLFLFSFSCCCSVAKSCLTHCDPMDCSTPASVFTVFWGLLIFMFAELEMLSSHLSTEFTDTSERQPSR